jgi:hypothetical protein
LRFINNFRDNTKKGLKMSKSKLLKEAIADAKAVRETAIQNAKIALEEAFTPRLQSILSRKLQAEMEDFEDEEDVEMEEEYGAEDVETTDSSDLGDGGEPEGIATHPHTQLDPETDEETAEVGFEGDDVELAEEDEMEFDLEEDDDFDFEEEDEDELDLEAIIRELEADVEDETMEEEDDNLDGVIDDPTGATIDEEDEELEFDSEEDFDDEIDLDEILREMGYGDDEESDEEMHEEEEEDFSAEMAAKDAELEEAYTTIKSLRKTINEVNLLNAKLLYTNKLFRSYNLNNEQKVKVVENLDRTSSVREVKLVYATLAESMKFTGTEKKSSVKKTISEGLASKKVASTAPKKEIITESVDTMADRFKKLAGIINN